MKTLTIYVDIRKSKELTLDQKKIKYRKLYTQFSSYKPNKNNISHRATKYVGDGVILIFDADNLENKSEIINLMAEIDRKIKNLENQNKMKMGIGISYSLAYEEGDKVLFIAPSIDGASYGVNLANKYEVKGKKWKWVLPLKVGDDQKGSIDELKEVIYQNNKRFNYHESTSGKNLWFEFKT